MLRPLFFLAALLMWLAPSWQPAHFQADRLLPRPVQQAGTPGAALLSITSPIPQQVLQGKVVISGSAAVEDFQAAELEFAYAGEKNPAWFFIGQIEKPVQAGTLLEWDTTAISDGDYTLRLVVRRTKGDPLEVTAAGLRVRNYSPVETSTPVPAPTLTAAPLQLATLAPTPSPLPLPAAAVESLPTLPSTPTALPANPAWMPSGSVVASLGLGVLAAAGVFILAGIYQLLKGIVRSFFQHGE